MKLLPPADMIQPSRKRPREVAATQESGSDSETDLRGVKKQARYVPKSDVPMTKEELSAWRKEARRLRNRESAAASRRKTRDRIEELEGQVNQLQSKYEKALARIAELESTTTMNTTTASTIKTTPSPASSWLASPEEEESSKSHAVSPSASPIPHEFRRESSCGQLLLQERQQQQQHMPMFSQSTVV